MSGWILSSDMSQFESHENKVVGVESVEKTVLEERLREAGVRVARSVSIEEDTKICSEKEHNDPSNHRLPAETSGNYTVHGGAGLVLLDVDVPIDELPEEIADLPSTFVVESPHGGYHLYYVVEDDTGISNTKTDWGSIRYEGEYVVGPGSTIDHARCDDGKANCPGEGVGEYDIAVDKTKPTLSGEDLEHLRELCASTGGGATSKEDYGGEKITLPDDTLADEGERYICTEFTRHSTRLAGEDLMDLLRGGTGSYELRRDDETGIDQSAADYYALELLYGAFLYRGEDEGDARQLALSVFKRYCRENPHDKTGNMRKWPRKGEAYLLEQMDAVQEEFEFGVWHRWRRREYEDGFDPEEHLPWTDPGKDGTPSLITRDTVRAALHILTSDLDAEYVAHQYGLDISSSPQPYCGEMFTPRGSTPPCDSRRYPVACEVGEVAAELNPEREASYFAETVKKLSRETDEVAHAYCPSRPNGERHVYYPATLSDPEDARWVKVEGEKCEQESESSEEASEKQVMTDGGENMSKSESHDKLDQIRRARSGDQTESDSAEVLTCPLCGQPMLSEGPLRNHVANSNDSDHRHRRLNQDLEVETEWSAMYWGPGAPT